MTFKSISVFALSSLLIACGGSGAGTSGTTVDTCLESSDDTFSCSSMISNVVDIAEQTATQLNTDLIQLETDINAYCGAINSSSALETAQDQWQSTMATMQQLEVMQFDVIDTARDGLYVWPSNDTCKTDLQVASNPNGTENIGLVALGRRTLTAVEYMLFNEDALASCADIYSTVENWIAATPNLDDRKTARCEYAETIVADLKTQSSALVSSLAALDLADKEGSFQNAANVISDALFYVDKQTKDAKVLAVLPQDGADNFSAASLESQFAKISKAHLKNNLLGAKAVLSGNDGVGLNDYLVAKGQTQLAEDMIAAIDTAIANIDSISEDMHTAITNADDVAACINTTSYVAEDDDITKICALQTNLKTFTDLLKTDFVLALSFSKPAEADGDND